MKVIKTMTNQIEVDKELFTALNECKSDDELRYVMTQPFYDKAKNRISSTDGRKLFVYNLTEKNDLQEGFYTAVKKGRLFYFFRLEDMDGQYPNIDRVIPDYRLITENSFIFCSKLSNCALDLFRLFAIAGPINIDYLKPIHGIAVQCSYTTESGKAIVLKSHCQNWEYIIMPMHHAHDDKALEEALKIFTAKFID